MVTKPFLTLRHLSYAEHLKVLNLLTLEQRRLALDLVLLYKNVHRLYLFRVM